MNRSYLNQLMLRSDSSQSGRWKYQSEIRARRAAISVVCFVAAVLMLLSAAAAQADFTLVAAPFSPQAVAPGGTSASNITVGSINGFTGTVDLTCQVSSPQTTTSPPNCAVSPVTVTPPATAAATITTTGQTTTVDYTITITGNGSTGTTHTSSPLNLTVLAVTPGFTIGVQSAVAPSSVPAGSGSQGIIVVNPINGYTSPTKQVGSETISGITLSCASITPLVTIPPICSFNPPNVQVVGVPAISTLTINTYGPVTTGANAHPKILYALCLLLPMTLVGLGAAAGGKRSRTAWGVLALFVLTGALFLMPACGNTTTSTTTPNGVTPNNTYTFAVVGVDADGVVSSNATSTTNSSTTVSLTVTSPAK